MRAWCVAAAVILCASCGAVTPPPDAIYVNGRIWTGDPSAAEAEALAVADGRITAVGTTGDIDRLAGSGTMRVDLGGRRVVPGFNDAHWHLPTRQTADLDGAGSVEEIQRRLRAFAQTLPPDAWVTGRGWGPSDFPDRQAHKRYLDDIFPDRAVVLTDRDGHQTLANSRALSLAGITRATEDPENGRIDRDPAGEPTGLLKESAGGLVRRLMPDVTADEVYRSLLAELDKAAAFGLTSLQVATVDPSDAEFTAYERALREGTLKLRLRVAVPFRLDVTPARLAEYTRLRDSHPGSLLRFGIAKGMLDGTVDAYTAAMLEPYANRDETGLPMWTRADLHRVAAEYDRAGLQIELHAIGDRAIRMALDAFESVAAANGPRDRRDRVEHIEVPSPDDVPRFAALKVIASTQAMFASPDVITLTNYAPALGPARAARSNSFAQFDRAGAVQAFGSDYPVFTMEVMRGIHTAVTRQLPDGTPEGGWYPEGRITVEAAVRHFTRDAAFAEFAQRDKGTLTAGRLADFVVLSDDIFTMPPADLYRVTVLLTVMGGRETYRSDAFPRRD
jgi:predicted amidohydrolase YtcJ